jgi:hypothetical protein
MVVKFWLDEFVPLPVEDADAFMLELLGAVPKEYGGSVSAFASQAHNGIGATLVAAARKIPAVLRYCI